MPEMIPNPASAHRCGAGWRQCLTERDEGRFDGLRRFGRGGLGAPRAFLRPGRCGSLIAVLPLVQPTFGTAHLPADLLNGIAVQVALHGELAAGLKVSGCDFTCATMIATFCMAICSRCHGTISFPVVAVSLSTLKNSVVKQGHEQRRECP